MHNASLIIYNITLDIFCLPHITDVILVQQSTSFIVIELHVLSLKINIMQGWCGKIMLDSAAV